MCSYEDKAVLDHPLMKWEGVFIVGREIQPLGILEVTQGPDVRQLPEVRASVRGRTSDRGRTSKTFRHDWNSSEFISGRTSDRGRSSEACRCA